MIVVGSSNRPPQPRHRMVLKIQRPPGSGNYITGYMGRDLRDPSKPAGTVVAPTREQIYPMAFLVEQDPDSILPAHFHIADQFQIFVDGEGALGNRPIKDVVVQFANTYSVYGPIKGGPRGISYLTVRNRYDPGARHMPASRDELPPPPRFTRQVVTDTIHPLAAAQLGALTEATESVLIPLEEAGLGAWHYRLPPGATVSGTNPITGEGQHWVVIGGTLAYRGELLAKNTCVFVSTEEPPFIAQAGPDGLEILALQYPFRATQGIATPA